MAALRFCVPETSQEGTLARGGFGFGPHSRVVQARRSDPLLLGRRGHGTHPVLWPLEIPAFVKKLYPGSHELYCVVEAT